MPRPPTHGVAVAGEEIVGISGTSGRAINALITWTCLIRGRTDDVDLLAREVTIDATRKQIAGSEITCGSGPPGATGRSSRAAPSPPSTRSGSPRCASVPEPSIRRPQSASVTSAPSVPIENRPSAIALAHAAVGSTAPNGKKCTLSTRLSGAAATARTSPTTVSAAGRPPWPG